MDNSILSNLTQNPCSNTSKDAIADLLKTDRAALDQFERTYAERILTKEPTGFFDTNSRQASEDLRKSQRKPDAEALGGAAEDLTKRIVTELLAQTQVYCYDGDLDTFQSPRALPGDVLPVTNEEIQQLPCLLRPQLTGQLMSVDIDTPSFPGLIDLYRHSLDTSLDKKKREYCYHLFRQGHDILDLDEITYRIVGMNRNTMGYWLPALVAACRGQSTFRIPATKIAKVPMPLLQLTRKDYVELTRTTLDIVDRWAHEAFGLEESRDYFIKTGTYSSKFDFRNARVHSPKEVHELGEYLLYIHYQALQMAGPLCHPCIYGVSTTNEWVVREYIEDKENNPTIYKGLPLHTEFRIFVDCDTDEVIGQTPYWEPNTMKKRFGHAPDANSPHQRHDYVVYRAHEEVLMQRYNEHLGRVLCGIREILPKLDLPGQWSIDVMLNGDELWIIDMATAERSALNDCIPQELRRPSQEDWLPQLPEKSSGGETI